MSLFFLANRIRWPSVSGKGGPLICHQGRSLVPLANLCWFLCPWQLSGHVTQFFPRRLEGTSTGGRKKTSWKVMLILKKGNSLFWPLDMRGLLVPALSGAADIVLPGWREELKCWGWQVEKQLGPSGYYEPQNCPNLKLLYLQTVYLCYKDIRR